MGAATSNHDSGLECEGDAGKQGHNEAVEPPTSIPSSPCKAAQLQRLSAGGMPEDRGLSKPVSEGTAIEAQRTRETDGEQEEALHFYDDGHPPPPSAKILLHSCCAPCSGAMFEELVHQNFDVTIFFYNPNIHPRKEYEIRKEENKRYARKHGVPFVDCDYDARSWFARMKGLEHDPERLGTRCTACFDMRMEVTAAYAARHGFDCFTTTNATSRWKDESQVDGAGLRAARDVVPGKTRPRFLLRHWKTDGLTKRKYEISAEERFYKQEYCGCSYSLRDSNTWRKQNGIDPVRIGGESAGLGTRYFEDPEADAEEESQEVVDSFFAAAEQGFKDVKAEDEAATDGLSHGAGASTATMQLLDEVYGTRKKTVAAPCESTERIADLNNW